MDLPPLPVDAPFDDIQRAIHVSGKAGAIQALALMEKVAELLARENVFKHDEQATLSEADRFAGWQRACAALKTVSQFLKEHANEAPVHSVETGKLDGSGQPEEVVQHFDPETIAQIIVEVVNALRAQG